MTGGSWRRGAWDLVIFDNDGVLVDSEPIANATLADLLTELGHPTTTEESVARYLGGTNARVRAEVEARSGRALPADFEARYESRVLRRFAAELSAVPGVAAVLDGLDVPYCLASSGTHARIAGALERTGLAARFAGRVFSAQDVAAGKPAPDLFLAAAAASGADPGRCAVIEDSPLGVQAAAAAGMACFGYTALTPPDRLAGSTALFSSMADLPALLAVHAPG